ncbi:MAG TPA: hypothetical protein VGF57_06340 [Roseiarcus sp.]|jgi:hypothetical protein
MKNIPDFALWQENVGFPEVSLWSEEALTPVSAMQAGQHPIDRRRLLRPNSIAVHGDDRLGKADFYAPDF